MDDKDKVHTHVPLDYTHTNNNLTLIGSVVGFRF